MEVIRGKWMTIPVGEAQFFLDFEPGANGPLSAPGRYGLRNLIPTLAGRASTIG